MVSAPTALLLSAGLALVTSALVKRSACNYGDYVHDRNNCCRCGPGYAVVEHCTVNTNTTCGSCVQGTYNDHPTSETSCQRCVSCNPNVDLVEYEKCTSVQDTQCKCKDGTFLSPTSMCTKCNMCEWTSVKIQCNATHDTVCNEHKDENRGAIAAAVVLPLLLIAGLIAGLYLYPKLRHRLPCYNGQTDPEAQCDENVQLQAVDLRPHLYEVSEIVGLKSAKRLATRAGMTKTQVDLVIQSHPNDAQEQCYNILHQWCEKIGLDASVRLIKDLQNIGKKSAAQELMKKYPEFKKEPAS